MTGTGGRQGFDIMIELTELFFSARRTISGQRVSPAVEK
jgi:hypothetical protein